MTLTLLAAADRAPVPWKNGGGLTRDVAAWPPGSGFDDFAWRVSMAEVRASGPFSSFPGVDRILAVLEGGLRLTIDGAGVFDLSQETPPLSFDGAAPVHADLTAGPVLDLNVMTRRGAAAARVERVSSTVSLPATPGARVVVALGDGVRVQAAGAVRELLRHDAVMTEAAITIKASADACAMVVALATDGVSG